MRLQKGWLAPDGEFTEVIVHEDLFSDEVLNAAAEGDEGPLLKAYNELMVKERWVRVDSEGQGFHGTLTALEGVASFIEQMLAERLLPHETFRVDVIKNAEAGIVAVTLSASEVFDEGFLEALRREIRSHGVRQTAIRRRPAEVLIGGSDEPLTFRRRPAFGGRGIRVRSHRRSR